MGSRQRFIHPEFWNDEDIAKLPFECRLFFAGLFSNADDDGRIQANPAYLRSVIFPFDDIAVARVKEMRDTVISVIKSIVFYHVDDKEYIAFKSWNRWQKPKYPTPSKLPPPPCDSGETLPKDCGNIGGILEEDLLPGMGREGKGMGRDRDGCDSISPSPKPEAIDYEAIVEIYHTQCSSLPKIRDMTDKRRKATRALWKKYRDLEVFEELFRKAEASDFLSGRNGSWSGCGFDWLMNTNNAVKVLEGNYDNKGGGQHGRTSNTGRSNTQNHQGANPGGEGKYSDYDRMAGG